LLRVNSVNTTALTAALQSAIGMDVHVQDLALAQISTQGGSGQCATGYSGPFCAVCATSYFETADGCSAR